MTKNITWQHPLRFSSLVMGWQGRRPLSPQSSRPQAVAPRPLWSLPPPASVASSPPFFTAPGSGSPSPVEVAPAGLCRVVASILLGPRQCPAGLCRVASVFKAPGSGSDAYAFSLGLKSLLYTRMATIHLDIFIRLTQLR